MTSRVSPFKKDNRFKNMLYMGENVKKASLAPMLA